MRVGPARRAAELLLGTMPLERGDVVALAAALLGPLLMGVAVHFALEPRARPWHTRLRKAPHRPPPAAFPLIWTYAYLAMGYASYLVYKAAKGRCCPEAATTAWCALRAPDMAMHYVHVALLQAWQFTFLYLRSMRGGMLLLIVLDLYVPAVLAMWNTTVPVAAYLLLPYLGWLLLLTYLNFYMLVHNHHHHHHHDYADLGTSKEDIIRQHNTPRQEHASPRHPVEKEE